MGKEDKCHACEISERNAALQADLAKACEETREAWGVIGQLMVKHVGKEGEVLTRKVIADLRETIAELEHDLAEEMLRSRTAEAEVKRLRMGLQRIADHHDDQAKAWEGCYDYDNQKYHEERRNVALFALHYAAGRGEGSDA